MKKIMFYINTIRHGGAERVITNLAKDLSNEYEVILATTLQSEDEYQLVPQVKRYVLEPEVVMTSRIRKNISRIQKLRNLCKKEKPDILISFMAEPNYRAILATRGLKVKTIISVRNDPTKEYAGKVGKFLAIHLLVHADGCVFQTKQAREWFPRKLQEKSVIIYNAVAEDFFKKEHNPIKGRIVTCGRLESQKNHDLLISSFSQLAEEFPRAELHIYGVGSEEKKLKSLVQDLNLSDRVFLLGTTDDVPSVLSEAALFVLSSDYEGMPNALMEALTIGVPCISTDCPCGGPQMLIKNNENGILVPVKDSLKMMDAMKKILSNADFADELGKVARKKAETYHPNKVLKEWKEYITEIDNK